MDYEIAINEALKYTNMYIEELTKGNDKLIRELDSLIDEYLIYYSKMKASLRGEIDSVPFISSGFKSSKYCNCLFSYEEIAQIASFFTNLCVDDLIKKDLLPLNNPLIISEVVSKYNSSIKKEIFKFIDNDREDEVKVTK